MNESNNVKFTEDNGKWVWKCYDTNGSVVHRSQLFDTEREAREDYEVNGGQYRTPSLETESAPTTETNQVSAEADQTPSESNTAGTTAPEGDVDIGNADTSKEDQVNTEQTA
jgi:IMP dehydrogenase/GMP reductase